MNLTAGKRRNFEKQRILEFWSNRDIFQQTPFKTFTGYITDVKLEFSAG